ncbi:hypothetical protein D9M68_594250 [compost metagenome]
MGAEAGVGVEQAAGGPGPDGGLEAVFQAGLGQQRLGLLRVVRVGRQLLGVAPGIRRVGAVSGAGAAFEHRLQVAGLVEGEVDRLAHLGLVQGRVLAVDADEGGHEGRGLDSPDILVAGGGLHVQRFGRQGDLALATTQLLQAHVGVGGDGEDQAVHARLAGEIVGVGGVAHRGVLLEALEDEGAGADGLGIELFRRAGFHQLLGVLGGIDGSEAHAEGGEEGGVRPVQGEAHLLVVDLVDALDQARQLHGLGVGEATLGNLVPGIGRIEHALEAEDHVLGVQRTARLEVVGGMEGHVLAQLEAVAEAVGRDIPALGQARHQLPALGVELHQAVHQHIGRGIGGGQGVVLHHVEALGAGLGADA